MTFRLLNFLLFILLSSLTHVGMAQSCLSEGLYLNDQSQTLNFASDYPDCTTIDGNIYIQGVSNFEGMEQITQINGTIICNECGGFTSFEGLNNVITVGGISIDEGSSFSFEGLDNLNFVTNNIDLDEASFEDFTGLESLITIGGYLEINENGPNNLNGLQSLISIGGNLRITESSITSLEGMSSLSSIGGTLEVSDCTLIPSLSDLEPIGFVLGGLTIDDCDLLIDLSGIDNIGSLQGEIRIEGNALLNDISAIANFNSDGFTYLEIDFNPMLSACSVASVCGHLLSNGENLISDNLENCNSAEEVLSFCSVNLDEVSITDQIRVLQDEIFITGEALNNPLVIYTTTGQIVRYYEQAPSYLWIEDLPSGIYVINLPDQPGKHLRFVHP
ncbi:hypothetical protein [Sanyastnella coralliicola]|uniref:hypothetical protein n=1 Tax=Sanyastnella coralliicola TaxID=3069118 RepID=UPI0027B9743B|nr:hypothetical protein [Longitalea sp. SCSIO 12813]